MLHEKSLLCFGVSRSPGRVLRACQCLAHSLSETIAGICCEATWTICQLLFQAILSQNTPLVVRACADSLAPFCFVFSALRFATKSFFFSLSLYISSLFSFVSFSLSCAMLVVFFSLFHCRFFGSSFLSFFFAFSAYLFFPSLRVWGPLPSRSRLYQWRRLERPRTPFAAPMLTC